MQADHQAQVAFHLTGRPARGLDSLDKLELRPALFSSYRALSRLRYDFPLVLVRDSAAAQCIRSLSALIDNALAEAAPAGTDGERVRKQVLQLEGEIRAILAGGGSGSLSDLWHQGASRLPSHKAETPDLGLKRVQAALKLDGELLDCGGETTARVFTHAWRAIQDEKASRFRERVARLILRLSNILKADFVASERGRSSQHLKACVGSTYQDAFDFAALSRMLASVPVGGSLSESRRRRIQGLIAVLEGQRFFAAQAARGSKTSHAKAHTFVFESCAEARKAFVERLPEQVDLAKALAAAELEVNGEYMEAKHDPYFEGFEATALDAEDHAQLPAYLVCLKAGAQTNDDASLLELLSAGVPVRIVLQFDDLLQDSPIPGQPVLSLRSKQLADMAIGLGTVFVLQSSASNLYQARDAVVRGLNFAGPALFCVYSGLAGANGLAPYLAAAAAMECRAFPTFSYDPSAGPDWASRFQVDGNPQPDRDWPAQSFAYEDQDHQSVAQELDFTLVDFIACDPRYARHFARVARENWNGSMVTVRESLAQASAGLPEKVPYLLMVDASDMLQRVIVDERLIREARRCGAVWRSLQELGGIRNSHAERLLEREKRSWEEQKHRELESLKREPAPAPMAVAPVVAATAPAASAPVAAAAAEPAEEKRSDEPYIETPRCTTCEECMEINKKMFVYDGNKQAYIADLKAGTYRQMVEAAESCQVSIIHPGKPWDPSEADLEALIARAEPFQ